MTKAYRIIERSTVVDVARAMNKYDIEVLGPLVKTGNMWMQPFVGSLKETQETPDEKKAPEKEPKPKNKAKPKEKPKDLPGTIVQGTGVVEGHIPDDMKD